MLCLKEKSTNMSCSDPCRLSNSCSQTKSARKHTARLLFVGPREICEPFVAHTSYHCCVAFLPVQALLTSVFELLTLLLSCPDSAASVRAIRVLHRLQPVATFLHAGSEARLLEYIPWARNVPTCQAIYAQVFEAGVRTLATAKAQLLDVVETELIALMVSCTHRDGQSAWDCKLQPAYVLSFSCFVSHLSDERVPAAGAGGQLPCSSSRAAVTARCERTGRCDHAG